MLTNILSKCAVLAAALVLSGCSTGGRGFFPRSNTVEAAHLVGPVAWHASNERQCLSSGLVRETPYIQSAPSIGRTTGCGAVRPFVVRAAMRGQVAFRPSATLRCPMITPLERWLHGTVQPAAARYLGRRVTELKVIASYSCRSRNGRRGAKLSEHGRANAIDISAFELDDGRRVTVKRGWRSSSAEADFLRAIHRGACRHFSTVLGPNADRHHHDHFHFDLARHGRSGRHSVCR